MSYNVATWRTKELVNFRIPMSAIHSDKELRVSLSENNGLEVWGATEMFEMNGALASAFMVVSDIAYGGEGSGWYWDKFKQLLGQSKGKLVSTQVWGGEEEGEWRRGSISKLTVIDGIVTEEEIEI